MLILNCLGQVIYKVEQYEIVLLWVSPVTFLHNRWLQNLVAYYICFLGHKFKASSAGQLRVRLCHVVATQWWLNLEEQGAGASGVVWACPTVHVVSGLFMSSSFYPFVWAVWTSQHGSLKAAEVFIVSVVMNRVAATSPWWSQSFTAAAFFRLQANHQPI